MTGFLNIDKPEGSSSAWVVNKVKHLSAFPCGHFGTLDPFASGVLPVGVGNATRLFDYFLTKEKTYRAVFRFGATTDTLDTEGEVKRGGDVPALTAVEAVLPRFHGEIEQIPPIYSAKSVNGERGYKLARRGEDMILPPRKVRIFSISCTGQVSEDEFGFEICCGAGTYIRALARDIASSLGTLGYCTSLRRTASGPFKEDTAISVEMLEWRWKTHLIPTDSVLPFPSLEVTDPRFYNGVRYKLDVPDGTYKIYRETEFYGTGVVEGGVLRADKKLC